MKNRSKIDYNGARSFLKELGYNVHEMDRGEILKIAKKEGYVFVAWYVNNRYEAPNSALEALGRA